MDLTFNTSDDFEQTKSRVTTIINNALGDYEDFLSETSINNLAVHLSIAIIRIRSNNYIPLSNSQINSYKQDHCYPYARLICERIDQEFQIEFPEAEVSLVSMHLSKNKKLDLEINTGFDLIDEQILDILKVAVNDIYEQYQIDFSQDDKLFIALGLHLEAALERLNKNQQVENPLKDKIIERHEKEFNLSKVINNVVEKSFHLSFDDDELAFIALHFVVANNRIQK